MNDPDCNCHQCTWLRASQVEREFMPKFQLEAKKECDGHLVCDKCNVDSGYTCRGVKTAPAPEKWPIIQDDSDRLDEDMAGRPMGDLIEKMIANMCGDHDKTLGEKMLEYTPNRLRDDLRALVELARKS